MRLAAAVKALLVMTGILLVGCASDWQLSASVRRPGNQPDTGLESAEPVDGKALPTLTEDSGLGDYLAYAALHNPGLEAAFNRWKAALERVPQVRALPDPQFTYRYFVEEAETRVGAQRYGFGIAQTFPWLGKLELRGYEALEAADAERHRYNAMKLRLFYQVKEAYYEYYYLWRAIDIVKQNISLLKNTEEVLRTRYKAGAAGHPEVVRAQVELGRLDDRLRTLTDLREPIVAQLNAAMNRAPAAALPWPKAIEEQHVSVSDEELLVWLKHANPQVQALSFEIDRARRQIELARKEYFPDIMVEVDYTDVIASVNLPIWQDKLAAGVREARHRHLTAVYQKADAVNTLSAELKLAAYRFRDADRRIDLYRDTLLPKAAESIKATDAAFRAGKASFTDLIDAERILLEFQLAYERALVDKAQSLAEMEMLAGKEIAEAKSAQAEPDVQKNQAAGRQ
jgi:outer membrane protein TolC